MVPTKNIGARIPEALLQRVEASVQNGKLRERGITTVTAAIERGLRLALLEAGEGPA